jgi:ATP-dependent DNA helicase RecQ
MTTAECLAHFVEALSEEDPTAYLVEKPPRATWSEEYAAWRFLHAWRQARRSQTGEFSSDHAVLLRQAVRWAGGITIPHLPGGLLPFLNRVGVEVNRHGRAIAKPFVPTWLTADGDVVPTTGIDDRPVLRRQKESIPGESLLTALNYREWQSQAQKEAVWVAVTAPKRSTSLIVLPTGTGKTLCFQAAAYVSAGLTVVIVPTVALAMDQWRAATEALSSMSPRYYASDDRNFPPQQVLTELKTGNCRLLFTSPESCVSGRLREFLENAATSGELTNLVIDEAHLVETWGASFRVDFQLLSSLRRKWLQSSSAEFRTILLSATVSPSSRRVLMQLYGSGETNDATWQEFSSQRLRPEMTYYYRHFEGAGSEDERRAALMDCAWHLPRPAIIYTTEIAEATEVCQALRSNGFQRVAEFTGDTNSTERRNLLAKWRNTDEIDLMVATSAFGVGVDKPDVRSIVHACLPENLNRYYQEVGRSGRDGASSVCVLLTTAKDFTVANSLLPTRLKAETLQSRWEAMWAERQPLVPEQDHIWKLTPRTQRLVLRGERSGKQNASWNKRLILQLIRAKKLELLNIEYEDGTDEEDGSEWLTIRILDFMPDTKKLGTSIAEQRDLELAEAADGLNQMREYITGNTCTKKLLRRTYGRGTVAVCGGCRHCRQASTPMGVCPPLPVEPVTDEPSDSVFPSLEVIGNCPEPVGAGQVMFRELVRQCIRRKHIRRFVVDCPIRGDLFATILGQVGEAVQGRSELFRVDTLDGGNPFLIHKAEDVAFIHVNRPSANGLALRKGRRLSHLFCGPFYVEPTGRHLLMSSGSRLFTDWRQWIGTNDGGG